MSPFLNKHNLPISLPFGVQFAAPSSLPRPLLVHHSSWLRASCTLSFSPLRHCYMKEVPLQYFDREYIMYNFFSPRCFLKTFSPLRRFFEERKSSLVCCHYDKTAVYELLDEWLGFDQMLIIPVEMVSVICPLRTNRVWCFCWCSSPFVWTVFSCSSFIVFISLSTLLMWLWIFSGNN